MTIQEAVKQLAGTSFIPTVLGKVDSVNEEEYTCSVQPVDESLAELLDIKLQPVLKPAKGIRIIPVVGSFVYVTLDSETTGYVSLYSEIQKIQIDGTSIIVNEGKNGGLIKYNTFSAELDKTNQALQSIISILTGTPITEPGNGSPSALQTALSSALAGKMVGDFSNIEDKTITI
jgi:hypothetical protein